MQCLRGVRDAAARLIGAVSVPEPTVVCDGFGRGCSGQSDHRMESNEALRGSTAGGETRWSQKHTQHRVLRHVRNLLDLQPLQEELPQLAPRPQIGEHSLGLGRDLVAGCQAAFRRRLAQLLVRQRIPQAKRQARSDVVAVSLFIAG